MDLKIEPKEIKMICRVCGNDQFESNWSEDDFDTAPDYVMLKCTYCGSETTKEDLIKDNSRQIEAAVDEMAENVAAKLEKELNDTLRQAFK